MVCGNRIFSSEHKYNSHSGWPAFYDVLNKESITLKDDVSHGKYRALDKRECLMIIRDNFC